MIDPAMCRPGRLDKLLFVELPNADERVDIFRALARRLPLRDEETAQLAGEIVKSRCDGFSGADLAALIREVGVLALRRSLVFLGQVEVGGEREAMGDATEVKVGIEDFEKALGAVGPSVTPGQRRKYEALRKKLGAAIPTMRVPEEKVDGDEV
jgi:ribosome biogenesis ATPase